MSIISDFLVKQVKEKGWLYIGNIAFESSIAIMNPTTSGGMVCLSPSAQMCFAISRMDTHSTFVIENHYLAQDFSRAGVEQSIVSVSFDRLQQFDVLIQSQWFRETEDGSAFVAPKIIKPADVESMVADEETGLYPNTDTFMTINDRQESTISPYPKDTNLHDYVGIRVKSYQEFVKTQKKFAKLCNEFFGLNDCI